MIAEVKGRLRQAGLRPNPMVEASGSRGLTSPDNTFTLGAELPLELGGRRKARVSVAEREVEMREAEADDFERKLAADIRMKYVEAVAVARNLSFTENLLSLTRDSHRLIQARVEKGKSAPLEQNELFVEVNRIDAMRISFAAKTEIAMFDLKKTIGMPPNEALRLKDGFGGQPQPQSQADIMKSALSLRSDLRAARAAEGLAEAQIEQARVEGKVDASVFANYMRQRMGFPVSGFNDAGALMPVDSVFHFATFGVRLTLPARNKNQGNIDAAVATLEAARNRREFNEIVVRNEVAAAFARYERAQTALTVYREGVRVLALRNLAVTRQVYTLGQKSLVDYLSEQRRYVDIETAFTEVLKEVDESLVEIDRAAGTPPAAEGAKKDE
jgi:cobalt-zinc-cadmium efflux system outer membrane protein